MINILLMHNHITPILLIMTMKLFKMVNFIFTLIVAVVSNSSPKIGQHPAAPTPRHPLCIAQFVVVVRIDHLGYRVPDLVLVVLGRRKRGPVSTQDLVAREEVVLVEVVEGEEGTRVVVVDVVLRD